MIFPYLLIFSLTLIIYWALYNLIGHKYALDIPDIRKQHNFAVPQIGGLVFGPTLLIISFQLGLIPLWYIIGGFI